jgi:CBS domain-containing protein
MQIALSAYTTKDLVVVHWMEQMALAYGIMTSAQVRHLPVVDDSGAIVGLISERDFQRASQDGFFDPLARVRDFMSWPVEAIAESATVADAARQMLDKKISSLIITREATAIGIVTTEDLLRSLLESHDSRFEHVREDVEAAIYTSPVGQIAHTLASIGI